MDLFAQYSVLDSINSYSSRSYAFVFFKWIEDAKATKDTLQGADLHGHHIKIEFAHPVCSHQFVLLLCIYIYIYVCVCVLGLVPLNPIVWCYVWYYVWHYVWLNIVINKVVLLLSEITVTWIFGHYHIVHEMHSMWFMWKVTEDINYKFFVNLEFSS